MEQGQEEGEEEKEEEEEEEETPAGQVAPAVVDRGVVVSIC